VLYGGIAVLGGLVLLESLFLPWYGLEVTVAGVEAGSSHSAWQAMSVMDVLLGVTAVAAVAGGAVVAGQGELPAIPLAAGTAGLLLSLVALIDLPEPGVNTVPGDTVTVGREAGPFVAAVAATGIALAGLAAMRWRAEAARPRGRSPARRRPARPPTAAPRSRGTGAGL
jgi:hypothetical protein